MAIIGKIYNHQKHTIQIVKSFTVNDYYPDIFENVDNVLSQLPIYALCRNEPQPRGGHSFVYDKYNNRFIAFGGLTSGDDIEVCVNDTYQLTIQNTSSCSSRSSSLVAVWKKLRCSGTLPSPRWCHSGVLQGDDMFVFGGWSYERTVGAGSGSKFFNDVHILNINTLVWTQIDTTGSAPRPRCQCACFLFEKKIAASERRDICKSDSDEEAVNDMQIMTKCRIVAPPDTQVAQHGDRYITYDPHLTLGNTVATSTNDDMRLRRDCHSNHNHAMSVLGHSDEHSVKANTDRQLSDKSSQSNNIHLVTHTEHDGRNHEKKKDDVCEEVKAFPSTISPDSSMKRYEKISLSDESVCETKSMTVSLSLSLSLSLPTSIASSSLSGSPKYSKASRGYMVIFGGSCHNQEVRALLIFLFTPFNFPAYFVCVTISAKKHLLSTNIYYFLSISIFKNLEFFSQFCFFMVFCI